ncbi:MAG: hypothetical protein ACLP9L_14165 [Thermoguttaceae bacterium]
MIDTRKSWQRLNRRAVMPVPGCSMSRPSTVTPSTAAVILVPELLHVEALAAGDDRPGPRRRGDTPAADDPDDRRQDLDAPGPGGAVMPVPGCSTSRPSTAAVILVPELLHVEALAAGDDRPGPRRRGDTPAADDPDDRRQDLDAPEPRRAVMPVPGCSTSRPSTAAVILVPELLHVETLAAGGDDRPGPRRRSGDSPRKNGG